MFGNLFEEEENEGLSLNTPKGRNAKLEKEPPPPRGRSNLCGIKNQGGTCYLNSLLQTLLFTPEFRGTDPANKRQFGLHSLHSFFLFMCRRAVPSGTGRIRMPWRQRQTRGKSQCLVMLHDLCIINAGSLIRRVFFPLRSGWSPWSFRDCLPVCCWWTSRVPRLLISPTASAGTAARSVVHICDHETKSKRLTLHFSFQWWICPPAVTSWREWVSYLSTW